MPERLGLRRAAPRAVLDLVLQALAEAREEIDALNVYPVPDGDTGTNLFLTFEAADGALREAAGRAGRRGVPTCAAPSWRTPGACCSAPAATPG